MVSDLCIPDLFIEAHSTAMEAVGTVVLDQCIGFAIQSELAAADTVGHTANGCPEVTGVGFIFFQGIIAENHVANNSIATRNTNGLNGSTVGQNGDFHGTVG